MLGGGRLDIVLGHHCLAVATSSANERNLVASLALYSALKLLHGMAVGVLL